MKSTHFAQTGTAIVMFVLFLLGAMIITNCSKETIPDPNQVNTVLLGALRVQNCDTFRLMVNNLNVSNHSTTVDGIQITPGTPEISVVGYTRCTSQKFDASAGYSELSVMDPTTNVVFTGGLVDGDSWVSGAYRTLIADRKPLKISISTQTNGSPSEIVEHPEQVSSFREAMNKLLARASFSAPAYVNFQIDSVYTEQQARMLTGANFSGWGAKVSGHYNFGSASTQSRLLVRFVQKYFTVDMDDPAEPCALFDTLPDLSDFGTSPMYISSVAYGRVAYLMISSSHRLDSVAWAINASYSGYGASGGAYVDSKAKNIMNQASISGFIVGGNGDDAVKAVNGFNGLKEYLVGGGNPSPASPGAPVSYTMKYLKNREVAKVQMSTSYVVRNCETIGEEISLPTVSGALLYDGCPIKITPQSDNDFGDGGGVKISGNVKLEIGADGRSVVAEIWVLYNESPNDDNPNDTRAAVVDTIVVCELPDQSKYINAILNNPLSEIDYTTSSNGNHHPPFTGDFLKDIIIQAAGEDDNDLPCAGYTEDPNGRAFIRMFFKESIRVSVKKIE